MTKEDIVQEVIKLHEQMQAELSNMERDGHYWEYERSNEREYYYAMGFADATEYYENIIDDIGRLIKSIGIDAVMDSPALIVSDKQKSLL